MIITLRHCRKGTCCTAGCVYVHQPSFVNVSQNKECIYPKLGNACYSVQNLLSSSLLSKKVKDEDILNDNIARSS